MKKLIYLLVIITLTIFLEGCNSDKESSKVNSHEAQSSNQKTNNNSKGDKTVNIEWEFKKITKIDGKDADGNSIEVPYTDVYLKIIGDEAPIKIGSYMGEATILNDLHNMIFPENTLSAVQAWYAGGGDDLIVVPQGQKLLVKWRAIDETTRPSIFDFKVVKEILIPSGYQLSSKYNLYAWEGAWTRTDSGIFDPAYISINKVSANTFKFELRVSSGGNAAEAAGIARIVKDKAIYTDKDYQGEIEFTNKNDQIIIKTTGDFLSFGGEGAYFDGTYQLGEVKRRKPTLKDLGVFESSDQEKEFSKLVGADYELFVNSFQLITEEEDLDHFKAKVYSGAVRGLYTINEAIIMINSKNQIWAAVIADDKVLYYTNNKAWSRKLPKTIEKWRKQFREKEIMY